MTLNFYFLDFYTYFSSENTVPPGQGKQHKVAEGRICQDLGMGSYMSCSNGRRSDTLGSVQEAAGVKVHFERM